MLRLINLFFILLLICSCNSNKPSLEYNSLQIDSLRKEFKEYCSEKDEAFRQEPWSPLTAADKKDFEHLEYFPYDIAWRLTGSIQRYEKQDSVKISGSKKGDIRPALRYGYFEFVKENEKQRLEIIKISPRKKGGRAHLFLGFWDQTSGVESYSGGRYIDLQENSANEYVIDFNYAYNPYCAYSERYSCAIPPLENRLTVAVRAGEKKYKGH